MAWDLKPSADFVVRDRTRYTWGVMAALPAQLVEKIARLPPERVAEVEDFVDFLAQRDTDRQLVRAASGASEAAFASVWDNPEDAAYDLP